MIERIASSKSSSTDHIHWWCYWNIYQWRALFKRITPDCSHRCRNRHHFERRTATEKKTGQLRLLSQELRFARVARTCWMQTGCLLSNLKKNKMSLFSRHNTRWKQPCPFRPLKKGLPRRAAKRRGKKRRLLFLPLTKESSVERATRIRWMQRIQFQWQMEELRCMEATSIHWTCFIQSAAKKKTEDQPASKTNNRWMHTCQSSQQKREWWHRAKSSSLQMRLRQSRELRKELLHEKVKCTYWMWTDLFLSLKKEPSFVSTFCILQNILDQFQCQARTAEAPKFLSCSFLQPNAKLLH